MAAELESVASQCGGSGGFADEWLALFYDRVTSQFELSRQSLHNTHNWAITLTTALVTAVVGLSLSESSSPQTSLPPLPERGLVAVLIAFPLMFRFFVRSCLECSIQYKWKTIRDRLDYYYLSGRSNNEEKLLRTSIELYYKEWRCPCSIWQIMWENMKLAYMWPFVVMTAFVCWGAATLSMTPLIAVSLTLVVLFMTYEVIALLTYRGFRKAEIPGRDA